MKPRESIKYNIWYEIPGIIIRIVAFGFGIAALINAFDLAAKIMQPF